MAKKLFFYTKKKKNHLKDQFYDASESRVNFGTHFEIQKHFN